MKEGDFWKQLYVLLSDNIMPTDQVPLGLYIILDP